MQSFIMKALTHSHSNWYVFSISDIPVLVKPNLISLMRIPNSPILELDTTRRGDADTSLFEGEIVSYNDDEWLICYERGFYAINKDYVICSLTNLTGCTKLGDVGFDREFPVSFSVKQKLLFKHNSAIFRLESICGYFEGKLLLRSFKSPIDPNEVKQDCGCVYNDQKLFLGDVTPMGTVTLHNGILGFESENGFLSIERVRKSNGCD